MKKFMKKLSAIMLVAAMVCTTFLSYMPSLDVLAAPKMMAHLKAGSGNANEHFGGAKPEAFVLSSQKFTGEDLSVTVQLVRQYPVLWRDQDCQKSTKMMRLRFQHLIRTMA